jgi:hypothetical protein
MSPSRLTVSQGPGGGACRRTVAPPASEFESDPLRCAEETAAAALATIRFPHIYAQAAGNRDEYVFLGGWGGFVVFLLLMIYFFVAGRDFFFSRSNCSMFC